MIKNNHKLNIGLDYHGVINKNFSYFSKFCAEARYRGHKIFIITGGPQPKIRQQLQNNNISYDFIFAISDYYQALGQTKQISDGSFIVPEHLWNMAKGEFCRKNNINFHIDDNLKYSQWFTTPFCLYKNNVCYFSSNTKITLTTFSHEMINKMEKLASTMPFVI